jgi:glycosyltransferase involved in cell wall biosynthesis
MKVALIIPCFNSIKYVDECINSALSQNYNNVEVHAYDNESTDGTYERLLEIQSNNPKLNVHQINNIYPNSYKEIFEHSFENLDADYFTFLASDDYIDADYVSNCVEVISYNPNKIKCIQSPMIGFSNDDSSQSSLYHSYKNLKDFKSLCMVKSPVNTPTVFFHKDLFPFLKPEALNANNLSLCGVEDYDMYCSLADNGIFIYPIPKFMGYYYRWHPDQCTWKVHKLNLNYDKVIQDYWKNKWGL